MALHNIDTVSIPSVVVPLLASVLIVLKTTGIVSDGAVPVLVVAAVLLGACVFSAVHHAEVLAARVGEPFGSIILAVAVTIIEVALIVSIMLAAGPGGEVVARDTVFSALMIVLNGVIGLCLVLGGKRHHEQSFQLNAAAASLAVLATVSILVLVLPNYTLNGAPGAYAAVQLLFVGAVCLVIYGVFIFIQTIRHRDYFMDEADDPEAGVPHKPPAKVTLASIVLLPVSLTMVVLLAKTLSGPLESGIAAAGLPKAFIGVVIAAIVLLPEGIASVRAAQLNRLQNAVNLVLGSALASISLTVPVVAVLSVATGLELTLGLPPEHMVLLILTLFVSTQTLGTGRTTVLQGAVHLGIFAVFVLLAALP